MEEINGQKDFETPEQTFLTMLGVVTETVTTTSPYGMIVDDGNTSGFYIANANYTGGAWYQDMQIIKRVNIYFIPTIVIIGLFGNLLSFLVFACTHLQRLSSSVYLAALAISDEAFLLMLLIGWLETFDIKLFNINGWCQAIPYLTYVFSFLSVWYVVAFTVERYIAVCYPLKRPDLCTVSRAKVVVVALGILALLFYMVSLFTNGIVGGRCEPLQQYANIVLGFTYIDSLITLIIPSLAIIFMNVKIAIKVAYFYTKQNEIRIHKQDKNTIANFRRGPVSYIGSPTRRSQKSQMKITKMLLLVSTVFLLLNLPHHSIRIYVLVANYTNGGQYRGTVTEWLVQQIFLFLYYTNFSINLLLYSAGGRNFRKAFKRLAGKAKYNTVRFFTHVSESLRRRLSSRGTRSTPLAEGV